MTAVVTRTARDRFVGRAAELGRLEAELAEASSGTSRVVVVSGPAGIGKTELVRRFLADVSGRALWVSGAEAEARLAYGVVAQLMAAAGAPAVTTAATPPDPFAVGVRLLDALTSLDVTPLVVVLDDAQWVDAPSMQAVTFALRRLRVDPVLTVVMGRNEPPGLPLPWQRLRAERGGTQLDLAGLHPEELIELADKTGFGRLSHRGAERLAGHTEGNPLYANSLLRAAAHLVAAAGLTPEQAPRQGALLEAMSLFLGAGEVEDAAGLAPEVQTFPDSASRCYVLGHLALLQGRQNDAERLLTAAWETSDATVDGEVAARSAMFLAQMYSIQVRAEEVFVWAERVRAVDPSSPLAAAALTFEVAHLAIDGRADEALARAAASEAGATRAAAEVELGRAIVRLWIDDVDTARSQLADVVAACRPVLTTRTAIIALIYLADAEFRLGAWDDSLVHAELAVSLAVDSGQLWLAPPSHAAATWVAAARGDWEAADTHVAAATAASRVVGDAGSFMYAFTAATHLGFCRADPSAVLDAVRLVLELPRHASEQEPSVHPWRGPYAEALVHLGRPEEAEAAIERFEAVAEARQRRSALAQSARARGSLEGVRGRKDQGRAAFESSLGHLEGLPMPFERALSEESYGRFLRRRGDRRAAAQHLGAARDGFARLGARPFIDRTDAELRACGLTPRARTPGSELRLTAQELSVARLVAQGSTNKEVAAELVVSAKTIEHHLSRVYAKLGVRSRTELAVRLSAPGA